MSLKVSRFHQFYFYLAGYMGAVILASFTTTSVYYFASRMIRNLKSLNDFSSLLHFSIPHGQFWDFFSAGILYTALFGFPGFLIAIAIAKRMNWKAIWKFAGAGLLNGAFAHFLVFAWLGEYFFLLIIASMIGGVAGGALYGIISSKRLASNHVENTGP